MMKMNRKERGATVGENLTVSRIFTEVQKKPKESLHE
jgi:hypothetical protein